MASVYEEVEVYMGGRFYTVIPCPDLKHPDMKLEDGEIFAVLKADIEPRRPAKPLAKKEDS